MNPLPIDMSNFYYESNVRYDYGIDRKRVDGLLNRSRRQMNFILNKIAISSFQTVLEIGAVAGGNLSLYKEIGKDVFGTELSQRNVDYAKKQYDINLLCADFECFLKSNQQAYDLVILSQVLEHIFDPYNVMKHVSSINTKYVFIEVPSFDFKYVDMPYGMFIPTHHSYFTMESLSGLMNRAGYKLIDANLLLNEWGRNTPITTSSVQSVWEKINTDGIKTDEAFPLSTISSEQHLDIYIDRSKVRLSEIANIIEQIPNDLRLAVYCVSRHTALLYEKTSLGRKNIIKFYDKDELFHNRKIMGLDVSSFCKADAEANHIEAILVSSYEYQPAIVNYIRDSGCRCDIITLYP